LKDGEDRLENHLEITKLIKKVQSTHDIIKSFYKNDDTSKKMAKINKRFVLYSSSSEEEN
jgi:hypothetical protein